VVSARGTFTFVFYICTKLRVWPCLSSGGGGVRPLGTSVTVWPIVPAMDDDERGAVDGMSGKGNLSIRRKRSTVPFVHHKSHMY
jgi:hypothetical protein